MSLGGWFWLVVLVIALINWRIRVKERKERIARKRRASRSRSAIYDPYRRNQNLRRGVPRTSYSATGQNRDALVYLVLDRDRNIAKIGFGSEGRVLMYFQTTQTRVVENSAVGIWNLVGVGQFSDRDCALKAESKVLYYWRSLLLLGPKASREQMGVSRLKVNKQSRKTYIGGHTETVESSKICLKCTWELVENSTGFVRNISLATIPNLDISHSGCNEITAVESEPFETYHQRRPEVIRQTSRKPANTKSPIAEPTEIVVHESEEEKFWSLVAEKTDDIKCWLWLGTPLNDYGVFHYKGSLTTAHRVCWMITFPNQTPPQNLWNLCGTKKCVNPSHWQETPKEFLQCSTPDCSNLTKNKLHAGICEKCKSRRRRERARGEEPKK